MKLLDIIDKDAVITELKATERDEAIKEIVDALVESGAVDESMRDTYVNAIIKREKNGSTGFGHGVAVPHVKHATVETMRVAVAVSQKDEGVEFNSLDRQPVFTIFLLLSPEEDREAHLDAMQAIFTNLGQETFRRFLRQASSTKDVLTLLSEADGKTTA